MIGLPLWSRLRAVPTTDEAAPNPVISRARLVTIPKRIPPALTPRIPYRNQTPVVTSVDTLSSPAETESQGLGVELDLLSPQENPADHENDVRVLSSTTE